MSRASLTRDTVGPHEALVLENASVRAVILPGLGGRVWTLEDRVRGRQWIWHRPGVPLVPHAPGAVYDDVWAGGWEELFPNDAPGVFAGRALPDHGEWWTMAFAVESETSAAGSTVCLRATSRIVRAECTKTFSLANDGAALTVRYSIRSLEPSPVHFLFKQHLPVSITPACRLTLPGGRVQVVDRSFGSILGSSETCDWPGGAADLRVIPPASNRTREFVYVRDLPAGWCGVEDHGCAASLRMHFDRLQVPFVWLFLSYGGWRDTYTAVLEPCTNVPKDLGQAVALGQAARLDPGAEFVTEMNVELAGLAERPA